MEQRIPKDIDVKETNEVAEIARFYGFRPIIAPVLSKHDLDSVKSFDQAYHPAEKAALLKLYFDERMQGLSQPVMVYAERPFHGGKEKKKPMRHECTLASLGSFRSVCECLSLETAVTMLGNIGYKNIEVHINSIGDKESMNEFQRKLMFYIKKNYANFPSDLKQAVKKDPLCIIRDEVEAWQTWAKDCPKPLDFLSESSRLHFKEVLEFLEIMNVPYTIDHHLLGDIDIGSETVFSIVDLDKNEILASGFRFNRMAKKIGCKKDLPCSVLNISVKLKKPLKKVKVKKYKPKFYIVQFGQEAKLRSFLVLKELYKSRSEVVHCIAKDKLSSQIGVAETSEAEYIILIGQKEALENSVVLRKIATRSQEIVPIPELAERIKELV